jgi:Domain of unknown function (DUF4335)
MTLSSLPTPESSKISAVNSNKVLRQYSSPTCTLEISANPSPLEKWTNKPTLKNQRFLLKFEDPRLSEDQWISLRGDRLKLATLTEAVTTYVQTFLSQSRTLTPQNSNQLTETLLAEPPAITSTQGIALEPNGLLAHTLKLGTIATEVTGESIKLTSTQLADLASVLEEHGSATLDLPALNRDTAWMRSPAAWGKIAALSLFSIGITASVLNQFSPKKVPTEIASQASSSDQRITPPQVPSPTLAVPSVLTPSPGIPSSNSGSSNLPSTIISSSNPQSDSATPPNSTGNSTPSPTESSTSDPSKTSTSKSPTDEGGSRENQNSGNQQTNREPIANNRLSGRRVDIPVAAGSQPATAKSSNIPTPSPATDDAEPPTLDLTSQIASIQSKIPQKWTPPEKFSGELKYLLEVAADGTLRAVTSEGSTNPEAEKILPTIGSKVAPPLASGSSPYKVRAFFFADKSVSIMQANGN